MSWEFSFKDKTAISTGAASGMGLLFAQNFAQFGGNVVLCDVNEKVRRIWAKSYRKNFR